MLNPVSITWAYVSRAVLIALAVLLSASWTDDPTYAQAGVSSATTNATIQGSKVADTWPEADQYTTIVRIDGSEPRDAAYDQPIDVSPGQHTIVVQFTHGKRRAGLQTTMNFEAGKSYVAKAKEVGSSWLELGKVDILIEEKGSSKVVVEGTASVDYRIPVRTPIN